MNGALIGLIPKIPSLEHIKQFRPISLCIVAYKVVTKILMDRVRPLIKDLIALNQCSVILGRQIEDDVIIAQEIIHYMRRKKGKKGYVAVKVDLQKVYDELS